MSKVRAYRFALAAVLACTALFAFAGCNAAQPSSSSVEETTTGAIAATVNGVEISEDDVTAYIESYRASANMTEEDAWGEYLASISTDPAALREDIIDFYVEKELMVEGAAEKGIEVTDEEVNEQIDKMRANYEDDEAWEAALAQAGTTEEQYRDDVTNAMIQSKLQEKLAEEAEPLSDDELLSQVTMYTEYLNGAKKSSHILFALEDKETAEKVLEQLKNDEITFEDAAKEYSTDTASAANGGNVGWDMLTSFVTEYTDALSALEEGEMSDLVESQYGYHIIKCTEVFTNPEGGVTSLDQVPDDIVDYIRNMAESNAGSEAYSTWIQEAKEKADIVINDMPEGLSYNVDMTKYQTAEEEASSEELTQEEVDSLEVEELTDEQIAEEDIEFVEEEASSEAEAASSEADGATSAEAEGDAAASSEATAEASASSEAEASSSAA